MYKVAACGYYKRGDSALPKFGSVNETLRDLRKWVVGKLLAETKTYSAEENSGCPTYLVDLTELRGDWLLTLWNELETTDGKVASIDGLAQVGRADVTMTEFEAGSIPGYATYFWFMPDVGLMASVRFQHAAAGHAVMNKYLKSFLTHYSANVVLADEENEFGDFNIIGYSSAPGAEVTHYMPQFKTELLRKPGQIGHLLKNSDRIKKVSKKSVLHINERSKLALWQTMLKHLHLEVPNHRPHEVKMNYEVEVNGLRPDQLQAIVDAWKEEDQDANNYGFDLMGESGHTYWLDHAFVKDAFPVDIKRKNEEIVNPESLLKALMQHRSNLLLRAKA